MKKWIMSVTSGTLFLGAVAANADEMPMATDAVEEPTSAPNVEISVKAGGHFPQLTNDLGVSFDALLKVGVMVAAEGKLQVFGEIGYSQPTHEVKSSDPRLSAAGAEYKSKMTVRDLTTNVGLNYFFESPASHLLPYAGAALSLHFLSSEVQGDSASVAFGDHDETSTQVGGLAFGGLGFRLGPGLVLGELRFGFAPVDQKVTGSSNVGSLSVLFGYGLMF